jgi:hypothetical protein
MAKERWFTAAVIVGYGGDVNSKQAYSVLSATIGSTPAARRAGR